MFQVTKCWGSVISSTMRVKAGVRVSGWRTRLRASGIIRESPGLWRATRVMSLTAQIIQRSLMMACIRGSRARPEFIAHTDTALSEKIKTTRPVQHVVHEYVETFETSDA